MEEDVERKAWNEYSEDLYNGDTEEQAAVNRCGVLLTVLEKLIISGEGF